MNGATAYELHLPWPVREVDHQKSLGHVVTFPGGKGRLIAVGDGLAEIRLDSGQIVKVPRELVL